MKLSIASHAAVVVSVTLLASAAHAQTAGSMDHASHMQSRTMGTMPAGQDAYATLAAVVATLESDSTTDWSTVNIEALRQHLIVMNEVTLRARVTQTSVAGGARMDVTGEGHVAESIRSMLHMHAMMLAREGPYKTAVDDIPGGVRFTVTAANAQDDKAVARIRGLGFAGLLTLGDHHTPHHLALARGQAMIHQ